MVASTDYRLVLSQGQKHVDGIGNVVFLDGRHPFGGLVFNPAVSQGGTAVSPQSGA